MEKKLNTKTDAILLADVFEKIIKVSTKDLRINLTDCVSLCSYT